MNKTVAILILGVAFCLTGCLTVPMNYTPKASLEKNVTPRKYDVTYSLVFTDDSRDEYIGYVPDESGWNKTIDKALRQSGYFSSVSRRDLPEKSDYHIHFIVHTTYEGMTGWSIVSACTLFIFPGYEDAGMDISAVLFHKGVKVYSASTSEKMRCFLWLPLAPVGIFLNDFVIWHSNEKRCLNYVLNQVGKFQEQLEAQE